MAFEPTAEQLAEVAKLMEYISDGEPMDDEELYASPVSTFEQTCSPEDKVFMSLDLNEATYNMPHELLEAQLPVLDKLMKDFPVWQCFRELFVCFEREIDMTNIIEVVAEIGHPTIQDRYLTNPLPIAYYAIKYHGYKRCVPYFLELMADKAIANQTSIDICDYDPLELISWIPLKGFKPGTLAYNSSQFMWTADGTSLWERSYPRVGLNSGIIQRISPSKKPKKLCFGDRMN